VGRRWLRGRVSLVVAAVVVVVTSEREREREREREKGIRQRLSEEKKATTTSMVATEEDDTEWHLSTGGAARVPCASAGGRSTMSMGGIMSGQHNISSGPTMSTAGPMSGMSGGGPGFTVEAPAGFVANEPSPKAKICIATGGCSLLYVCFATTGLIPLVIFCVFIGIPVLLLGATVFGWLWDTAKVIMLAPIRAPIWIWQELSGARLVRERQRDLDMRDARRARFAEMEITSGHDLSRTWSSGKAMAASSRHAPISVEEVE
jgi:hypothetical protein